MNIKFDENRQNRGNLLQTSEISDFAKRCETEPSLSWREKWLEAGELGLLAQIMPKELGGAGMSARSFIENLYALGEGCSDNGLTMGIASHIWTIQLPIARFATEAQKAEFLPTLSNGQQIGAFALTEANAGSDALSLETTAVKSDDGYILNGSKIYIGMGPECDLAIVFANTAPERGSWGISAFLVKSSDKGFIKGAPQKKIGLKTLPFGALDFNDCWIPQDRLLGKEGAGAQIIQNVLDWERCFILAPHIGAMKRQLARNAHFASERKVFNQSIGDFQSVSNRIADMRVRLETSQLMLARAAELFDQGALTSDFAAMANLHMSEAILASSLDAFRNMGGMGYLDAHKTDIPVQDAMGGVVYSGTSDIQRQIIAKLTLQKFRN